MVKRTILGLALALGVVGTAQAEESDGWRFAISPYAWMSGLEGKVGRTPAGAPVEVDLSFSDILDDLEFAGMVISTARKGPWVVYLDISYTSLSTTERLGGVVLKNVSIDSKTTFVGAAVGRTVAGAPQWYLDAYLGARAWWLDNDFTIRGVGGGVTRQSDDADWISPLIGVSGRYEVSDRWSLFGTVDVGGFGIGADLEWSVLAGATYKVSDRFELSGGWRHLEVDYDDNGSLFDVRQTGPILGATVRF